MCDHRIVWVHHFFTQLWPKFTINHSQVSCGPKHQVTSGATEPPLVHHQPSPSPTTSTTPRYPSWPRRLVINWRSRTRRCQPPWIHHRHTGWSSRAPQADFQRRRRWMSSKTICSTLSTWWRPMTPDGQLVIRLKSLLLIQCNDYIPLGLWNLPERNGKIPNIDQFDVEFFGIPEEEVPYIDPQERLMLETTYEAIVDSGTFLNIVWIHTEFVN